MKRFMFSCLLAASLFCLPMTAFAAEKTKKEARQEYQEAIADTKTKMQENSIALDEINAKNKTYRLEWQQARADGKATDGAKELVAKIRELQAELKENQDSTAPYREAKKACAAELNADGANAAMENIIQIQEFKLEKKEEINKLWKKVHDAVK